MDVVSEAAPLLVAAVPVGDLGGAVQDVRTVPGGPSQPSRLVADASGAPPPSSSRVPTTPGEPPSPPSGSSAPPRASPQTGAAPPPGASPASTARVACAVCAVARAALIIPGRGCLPEHESDGTDLLFAKAMEAPAAIAARGAQGGVLNSSAAAAASPSSAIPTLTPSSSSPSLYALADAVAALPAADALILHFHSAAAAALDPKSPDAETASALLAVFQEAVVSELISLAVDFGAHAGGMLDGKMPNLRRPPGCGVARVDALVRGTVADGVPAGSRVPCENGSSLLVWRLLCDVAGLSSDAMGAISQPTTSSAEALAMGSADLLRAVVAALPAAATDSALEEIAQLILCALTFTATDGVAYAPRDALTNIDRGLALLHALFAVPIFAKGLGGTVAWERSSIRAHDGRRTRSPRVLPPAVVRALGATEAWAGSLHGALHLSILGALLAPSVVPTATARPFLPQGAAAAPRVTELSPLWHLFAGASDDPWHIDPSKILSATKDVAAEARVHRDKVATFALSFLKAARAEAGPAMFRWADAAWEAQVLSEKNPHSAALAPPRTGTLVNAGLLFVRLTEGLSLGVEPILLTGRPAPPLADASKPDPANPDTFALVSSLPGAQFNGSHASHATGTFHFAAMLLNKGLTRVACGLRDDEEREIQFLFKTLRDAPDATVARERLRQVLGSKHAMNAVRADPVLLAPVLRFTALTLEHCARRVDESSGRVGLPLPPFADGHGNIDAPDAHVVVTLQLLKCIAKTERLYRVPLQWRILNTAFSETRALVAAPKGVAAVSASPSAADALPAPPPSLARILFNGLLTMIGSAPLGPARVHAGPRDDSPRDTAVDAFYGLFVPPFARARALPTDNPEPLSSLDATAWGAQFEALAGGVPGGLPVTVLRGLLSVFVAVEKQPTHVNDDFNRQCTRERILSILALVWSRRGPWEGALAAALDEPFAIALCSHMADAVNSLRAHMCFLRTKVRASGEETIICEDGCYRKALYLPSF